MGKKNTRVYSLLVLIIWCGLFSCEKSSSLRSQGSFGADSLDDIEIALTEGKDIIEYEDVYRDPGIIVSRKKFWSGYKQFTAALKTDPLEKISTSSLNKVISVLGEKKLVMVTPAIWEDGSHFLMEDSDRKNTREYRLFDQIGDFFIHPMQTTEDAPNGSVGLSRWVWGYGESQDVYMDIFVESEEVYLIIGFPLHKKSARQKLEIKEAKKIQELQRGIGSYIIRGRVLSWPFGTSVDQFFSKKLAEVVSHQFSTASYDQISTFTFGAQALVTQYRALAEDTFIQMSSRSSDGFIHSNTSNNEIQYYSPGAVTQSIAYSESGNLDLSIKKDESLFATENSILVVPFLIQKVLSKKEGKDSQQGYLLRGNPLAMRVISFPNIPSPIPINYPSGVSPVFPQSVTKIDVETGAVDALNSFVTGKESGVTIGARYMFSSLFSLGSSKKKEEKEEIKKPIPSIFKIDDESKAKDSNGKQWTRESLSEYIRKQLGTNESQKEFSWSGLKALFDRDSSQSNVLRAKKKLPVSFTDENYESFFDWRNGVAQHTKTKDYSVRPLLQYAGFDLIFWPEEDLDYVRSFMIGDFAP